MNPAKLAKASRCLVIPCDTPRKFHVMDPGHSPHVVIRGERNPDLSMCDCRSGSAKHLCGHRLALQFYFEKQRIPA